MSRLRTLSRVLQLGLALLAIGLVLFALGIIVGWASRVGGWERAATAGAFLLVVGYLTALHGRELERCRVRSYDEANREKAMRL